MRNHMVQQLGMRLMVGYKMVVDPNLSSTEWVQTKYPRCNKKKRRVTKKFWKRYSKKVLCNNAFIIHDLIVCNPQMAQELERYTNE